MAKRRTVTSQRDLTFELLDGFFSLASANIPRAITAFVIVAVSGLAAWVLVEYAGKRSVVDVFVSIAMHVRIAMLLSFAGTGATSLLYFLERREHRRTTHRLSARCAKLERMLDTNRESSHFVPEEDEDKNEENESDEEENWQ